MCKKNIYVFLKNKIISLDVIIPFCMEVNSQCNVKFIFIVRDLETYKSIVDNNIVLRDAINSIGKIIHLSKYRYKLQFISRIFTLSYMLYTVFRINIKKDYLIHFGLFNVKPFSLLCHLLNRKRIIFSSSSSYGVDDKVQHSSFCAGILLGFSESWMCLKLKHNGLDIPKIIIKRSRNLHSWIDFVKERSDIYINLELERRLLSSNRIIIFPIGKINLNITLDQSKSFVKTLGILAKYSKEYTIFIKPAIYTNLDYVRKLINDAEDNIKINYIFTKLHPTVLASRAIVSVFVNKATIINEMKNLQVPVIQCLYASEKDKYFLDEVSPKADYIVSNSSTPLYTILDKIIKNKMPPANHETVQTNIDCGLFFK
jgi:hypothetical protein